MKKIFTKGDVLVNEIKVGDIHYEYEYGCYVKSKVITIPENTEPELWEWKSVKLDNFNEETDIIIDYAVNEKHSHYGPNLYDTEVYMGCTQI